MHRRTGGRHSLLGCCCATPCCAGMHARCSPHKDAPVICVGTDQAGHCRAQHKAAGPTNGQSRCACMQPEQACAAAVGVGGSVAGVGRCWVLPGALACCGHTPPPQPAHLLCACNGPGSSGSTITGTGQATNKEAGGQQDGLLGACMRLQGCWQAPKLCQGTCQVEPITAQQCQSETGSIDVHAATPIHSGPAAGT